MENLYEQKLVTFEEDYLYRTNKTIISNPDYALTEAIANCWDAGATEVNISLPEKEGDIISIEDNGTGMTDEEFMKRWMVLSYNRQRHQGLNVVFPDNNEHGVRRAYGKNGVGRHGLLCFNDNYYISTWRNGTKNTYHITVSSGNAPFKILEHNCEQCEGHGTKIWTYSSTNTPNVAEMKEIISSRFLYDPNFKIIINGELIELTQHKGVIKTLEFDLEEAQKELVILRFEKATREWLEFVCCNRSGGIYKQNYDMVIGPVADDKVYSVVVRFENGEYDLDEALKRLKIEHLSDQILFHNEKALQYLRFEAWEEVR